MRGSTQRQSEQKGDRGGSYLPCSSSGFTDCCRGRWLLVWPDDWLSNEMRFFTGGWLKV